MIQNKTVMWLTSCPYCDFPPPSPPLPLMLFLKVEFEDFHPSRCFFLNFGSEVPLKQTFLLF